MILIIGAQDEIHSKYIYDKLIKLGEQVEYFDTRKIPNDLLISWAASEKDAVNGYFKIGDKKISMAEVKSVYWRNHFGYSQPLAYKDFNLKFLQVIGF